MISATILTFLSLIYYLAGSSLLYLSLHSNAWDLGIFNQVLYNTLAGHPFAYSFRSFGNYLGDHFSPILLFISPLSAFKTSLPILALQAVGVSLAVLVLYLLSREMLKSKLVALAVAFSFAINPFTINILNFDFHPDFLFPLLFFAAFYFLVKSLGSTGGACQEGQTLKGSDPVTTGRRYLIYSFVCVVLLQLIREDAALLIGPLAILAYFKFGQKKWALSVFAFSLIYSLGANLVIMPIIRGGASSPLAEHYPYLGRSVGEIGLNVATHPGLVVRKFLGTAERTTIIKFFGSTGFLSLLSPITLILSAPIFAAHFLSVISMRINLEGHYPSQLLAFMYVAVVFGVAEFFKAICNLRHAEGSNIRSISELRLFNIVAARIRDSSHAFALRMTANRANGLISGYLVLTAIVSFALFSPFPPSLSASVDRFTVRPHHELFWKLLKSIPDGVPVSAQTNLVPALAFRRGVYEFPDLRDAAYVVLDEGGPVSGQSIEWGYNEKKNNLTKCGYSLITDEDGFKIYKKDPGFNLWQFLGC